MFRRIVRLIFLVLLLVFLGASSLAFLAFKVVPSTSFISFVPSQQTGFGGAFSSSILDNTQQGRVYGGSGSGGACLGTSGLVTQMLSFDFGWDQTRISAFVNGKWLKNTTDQLCNDRWPWDVATTLSLGQVVGVLQWPADLIQAQWTGRPVTLRPLQAFDLRTLQAQQHLRNDTPTPTQTPLTPGQGRVYGGSGSGGACLGTSGPVAQMLSFDFGWDQATLAANVDRAWLKDTPDRLCNDNYFWEAPVALPAEQVLLQLQWPASLLHPIAQAQTINLRPLSTFDAQTVAAQHRPEPPTGPCDWTFPLLWGQIHIDVCAPLRLLLQAGAGAVRNVYHATASQIDFLWTTPLAPFQDNGAGLVSVWNTSWAVVLTSITAVLAWGALRYMIGAALSWLAYANLIELIPRVIFALVAALYSKQFFITLIQMNNAISHIFNANALSIMLDQSTSGIINSSIQILYGILAFVLILENIARIAVIYLLFALAPLLFFLASLRETQRFAKNAAVAALLFIFLQAAQAAALDVGGQVLTTVLHNQPNNLSFLNMLVSLAILFITLSLFFGITRIALGRAGDPIATLPLVAAAASARFGISTVRHATGAIDTTANFTQRLLQPLPYPSPQSPRAIPSGTSGGQLPPPTGLGPALPPGPQPGAGSAQGGGTTLPSSSGATALVSSGGSGQSQPGKWQKTPRLSASPGSQMPRYYANVPSRRQIPRPELPKGVLPGPYAVKKTEEAPQKGEDQ